MTDLTNTATGKRINFRLAQLIKKLPVDQQVILLKQLLQNDLTSVLFDRIGRLSSKQQAQLVEQLEACESPAVDSAESEIALRNYSRQSCMLDTRFTVDGVAYRGLMLDISPAGAFVETRHDFSGGQPIELQVTLGETSEAMVLAGEILWKGIFGIGVKFKNPDRSQRNSIQHFLDRGRSG